MNGSLGDGAASSSTGDPSGIIRPRPRRHGVNVNEGPSRGGRVSVDTQTENESLSQLPLMDSRRLDLESQSERSEEQMVKSQLSQSGRLKAKDSGSGPMTSTDDGSKGPKEVEDDDDLELEFQHFDDEVI